MKRPPGWRKAGSVVGIQVEVAGMYTGTLIRDLMTTVQRAEQMAQQRQIAFEQELHAIFSMPIPITNEQQVLGAA